MRKLLCGFVFGVFGALLLTGCSTSLYEDPENWAIIDNDTPAFFADFDLVFLYPSPERQTENGYFNWLSGPTGGEVRRYVRLVISSQFGPRVRVFSPFVPMLGFDEYEKIIEEFMKNPRHDFDFYQTKLRVPIDYMINALEVYLKHYNSNDHPFVLYGQEQGGLVLYEAMKRCKLVHPENGFVVGYFFGVPGVTPAEIKDEFGGRGIRAASCRNGVGVVVICNTRAPGEPLEHTFALPGGAVVNPLSWSIDATPVKRRMNPGALFYDRNEQNPTHKVKRIPQFCGAVVDRENGLVNLTEVPAAFHKQLSERLFESKSWGVFPRSVSQNAKERVSMYRFGKTGMEIPK